MTSFTTRHLKVCFEVDVQTLPLPNSVTAKNFELAALQGALLDRPELLNQALTCYAFNQISRYLHQVAGGAVASLLAAIRDVKLNYLHPLLYECLVNENLSEYLGPIFLDGFATQLAAEPRAIDLENGASLDWQIQPQSIFQRIDERNRFLLAEVQGETVLCLNLVGFDPDDIIDAAAYELEAGFQRILVFLSDDDFSPEEQDDLAVRLVETFGELPVEIYTGPQTNQF